MSIYYLDSSALAKRYLVESGTTWVRELCSARDPDTHEPLHDMMVGEIARVEVFSAIARRAKSKQISEQEASTAYDVFATHLEEEYQIVILTSSLIISAAQLARRHAIRAYDAVQLALAVQTNNLLKEHNLSLTFVASDKALLRAAQAEGLATENPADHEPASPVTLSS